MADRYYSSVAVPTNITAGVSASATQVTLASIAGYPTQFPFTIHVDLDTASEEIMTVTAATGNVFTVLRGEDGSGAFTHTAGAKVVHGVSARDFKEVRKHDHSGPDGTGGRLRVPWVRLYTFENVSRAADLPSAIPVAWSTLDYGYPSGAAWWSSGNPTVVTAPSDGLYSIVFGARFEPGQASKQRFLSIRYSNQNYELDAVSTNQAATGILQTHTQLTSSWMGYLSGGTPINCALWHGDSAPIISYYHTATFVLLDQFTREAGREHGSGQMAPPRPHPTPR